MAVKVQSIGTSNPLNATLSDMWQLPRYGEIIRLKRRDGSIDSYEVLKIEHPYIEDNFFNGNIFHQGDIIIYVKQI
jgi:hypothetical protein